MMFALSHQKCLLGGEKHKGGQPKKRGKMSPQPKLLRAGYVTLIFCMSGPHVNAETEGESDTYAFGHPRFGCIL